MMSSFEETIQSHCQNTLDRFKRISRFYTLFHLGFLCLSIGELLVFLLFFSFFTKSTILAFSLAALFLTGFSYFVLHFYFQAKRPEQIHELHKSFLQMCQESIPKKSFEYHHVLAQCTDTLVKLLDKQEYHFYSLPSPLTSLNPVLQKFSSWSHWKDIHELKEKLLFEGIEQYVAQIKLAPTNLEAHGSLAIAYLQLARLYQDPRKLYPEEPFPWISPEYGSEAMQRKFENAAKRAIEEYKILDVYAPNSLWTYAQLASIYNELQLPQEEMLYYEKMLEVAPHDKNILFRLGVLYFQQGLNAKALKIYETLQHTDSAEKLIEHYNVILK